MYFFVSISCRQHLIGCFSIPLDADLHKTLIYCCLHDKINNPSRDNCCLCNKMNNPFRDNCCLRDKMNNPSHDICCLRGKMKNPSRDHYFLHKADYIVLFDLSVPPDAHFNKTLIYCCLRDKINNQLPDNCCLRNKMNNPLRNNCCLRDKMNNPSRDF